MLADYLDQHKQRFLDELLELLRIPSVSADSNFKDDVRRAAEFVREKLAAAGLDDAQLFETAGHPIVFAQKLIDPTLPTVLVYGHYDVQPADPYELWETAPFDPVIKDGQIYARGASDDKGQVYMHIKALETMLATEQLPCNIKFIIEGEEENGSHSIAKFLEDPKNCEFLQADAVLVSDTSLLSLENPSITSGLRGITYFEVEVSGPNRDLHSGSYGGAVGNPINMLCQMIAALKDDDNRITIPGFYNGVEVLTAEEQKALDQIPFDLEAYKQEIGIAEVMGEKGYSTLARVGVRPSLDVNGIWGGYTAEGAKTVLPAKAHAKLSMRLVPGQNAAEIVAQFTDYFTQLAPKGAQVSITVLDAGSNAVVVNSHSIALQAASKAFEETWGKSPLHIREGGSIPIVTKFKELLKCDIVLMGFGLASDAIHSPNEHFGVVNFFKGIDTIIAFYKHLAVLKGACPKKN